MSTLTPFTDLKEIPGYLGHHWREKEQCYYVAFQTSGQPGLRCRFGECAVICSLHDEYAIYMFDDTALESMVDAPICKFCIWGQR